MNNLVMKKNISDLQSIKQRNSFSAELEYEFFNNFESAHTRKSYRSDISQFFEFLSDHFALVKDYEEIKSKFGIELVTDRANQK